MEVREARVTLLRDDSERPHAPHARTESVRPSPPSPHSSLSRSALVVTSLFAGASAGALAKTTIAPLDRTKINFQISQTPYSWRGAINFLVTSARVDGPTALWRGNSATMARIIPYAAIQFTAHENWKRILRVDTPADAHARPLSHLVAGSLAGVTSQSLTYPLDVARARMAVSPADQYRTLRAVFYEVVKQEGFRALYRGYPATVIGVIPYAGVSFFTYDSLKHKYLEHAGCTPHGLVNVALGGAAGALGQTASYPLDIVRRRMQTARRPQGNIDTLIHVYTSAGWRGFFKGLSMNWVKGPIAVGISFATYDAFKEALRDLAVRCS